MKIASIYLFLILKLSFVFILTGLYSFQFHERFVDYFIFVWYRSLHSDLDHKATTQTHPPSFFSEPQHVPLIKKRWSSVQLGWN